MVIKGVVFDFNGTLVRDGHLHNIAWLEFLKKYRIPLGDPKAAESLHGRTNHEILNLIFSRQLSADEAAVLGEEKEAFYRRLCIETRLELMPGAVELFHWLKNNNIPSTIATASDKENVDFYFEFFPLNQFFERQKVVYNDGSFPGKPHPGLFLEAIRRLDIPANQILIFEDSANGILAAERAGCGKIVVVDSHHQDYSAWNYPKIETFNDLDYHLFAQNLSNKRKSAGSSR